MRISVAQCRVLGLTARVCSGSIVPHSLCWLPRSPLPFAVSDVRVASVTGHKEVGLRHLCRGKNSFFSWPGVLGEGLFIPPKKLGFFRRCFESFVYTFTDVVFCRAAEPGSYVQGAVLTVHFCQMMRILGCFDGFLVHSFTS